MKNKYRIILLFIFFIACKPNQEVSAQSSISISNAIDKPIERHKWELNVNVVPLLKLAVQSDWVYIYLIKRNVGLNNNLGAWRFTLNPYLIKKNQTIGNTAFTTANPKSTYFVPSALVGYEWQKVRGRFAFYYGADLGSRVELNKTQDDNAIFQPDSGPSIRGKLKIKSQKNAIWLSPLIGAKYYLNHRFAISLESQIQFSLVKDIQSNSFNNELVSKTITKNFEILPFGSYSFNISYNL
jgi:hypothetical protein